LSRHSQWRDKTILSRQREWRDKLFYVGNVVECAVSYHANACDVTTLFGRASRPKGIPDAKYFLRRLTLKYLLKMIKILKKNRIQMDATDLGIHTPRAHDRARRQFVWP
jgi:hypothetical protein